MSEISPAAATEKIQSSLIRAVSDLFRIQFSMDATAGTPFPFGQIELPRCEVAGVGALTFESGNTGFALCFPKSTCLSMMTFAMGRKVEEIDSPVSAGVLELVSILGARSKSLLREKQLEVKRAFSVSCVSSEAMHLMFPRMQQSVVVPFGLAKIGDFYLQIF